ncbi:connectin-like [Pararge aegeria]|uniref:Jg5101 protein n=1 Tax=Pararge aegeria aegeria TaxID=348720 RepID=A0A8S4S6T2_9NEOP|nr:connectin-like [Pararge aegeria]CAH2245265.1 jg5101 [Pararge aegeria aegeria]
MEEITKYIVIIASLMTAKLTVTESKNETKPKIDRRHYQMPIFINVCDIVDRRSKVHCYCDNNKPKLATRADCWIFGGGLTEDDPIWPSFTSQSEIEHLMFNVRTDDALTFVPAKAIVRLDRLKHLSIQFGTIKTIYPYAFTNSSTIRQLVLKSNKIANLEKHSFAQMMMLSNLSLDDNQISELKMDVFFNLPNLHILHLSNNNVSLIHEGCFKHLNNLIELKLDNNYISVIIREMLAGLENLSRLNLRNNKLEMIGNLAFTELWGLKELMLDNNAIEFISERAFGGLTQLRKLTLSGNKLTTFYEYILEDIRSLVMLDLRDNLLTTISYETIRPVVENDKSLSSVVYLDGNPLSCNCRLSWIYVLRNETQDNTMKHALEKISCVPEPTNERRVSEPNTNEEDDNSNILADDNYEYYDKGDEYNDKEKNNEAKAVKLTDIPLEELPCPKELMQSIEETYGHPVQNEIRLKGVSKGGKDLPSFIFIVTLLVVF